MGEGGSVGKWGREGGGGSEGGGGGGLVLPSVDGFLSGLVRGGQPCHKFEKRRSLLVLRSEGAGRKATPESLAGGGREGRWEEGDVSQFRG